MVSPQRDDDSWRENFSRFASGIEHIVDSLQEFYHLRTAQTHQLQRLLLHLAIRCLVFQSALGLLAAQFPKNACTTFNQLFYPTLLLYRYIWPTKWDKLFMATVKAIGCETRADIVGRPGPRPFVELRLYLRRTLKAYFGVGIVHFLVDRPGFVLSSPYLILAQLLIQQYLRYRGVQHAFLKVLILNLMVGPRWTVWFVQVFIQQQMFLYELLQPYFARIQFKKWEEYVWLQEHEPELLGFAMGAWILCSIPFIGVAAIPLMFSAVAFLLSRSCGLMQTSGLGSAGDLLEKHNPGVKEVAQGKSKAVSGDWDLVTVETLVRNSTLQRYHEPSEHVNVLSKDGHQMAAFYALDHGDQGAVTSSQVKAAKKSVKARKRNLLLELDKHEQARRLRNNQYSMGHPLAPTTLATALATSEAITTLKAPTTPMAPIPPAALIAPTAPTELEPDTATTQQPKDLRQYNFSDRKTLETVPSAPPAPASATGPAFIPPLVSSDMQVWSAHHTDAYSSVDNSYHIEPKVVEEKRQPALAVEDRMNRAEYQGLPAEDQIFQAEDSWRIGDRIRQQLADERRREADIDRKVAAAAINRAQDNMRMADKVRRRTEKALAMRTIKKGVHKSEDADEDVSEDSDSTETSESMSEDSEDSDDDNDDEDVDEAAEEANERRRERQERERERERKQERNKEEDAQYFDEDGRRVEQIPLRPRTGSDQGNRGVLKQPILKQPNLKQRGISSKASDSSSAAVESSSGEDRIQGIHRTHQYHPSNKAHRTPAMQMRSLRVDAEGAHPVQSTTNLLNTSSPQATDTLPRMIAQNLQDLDQQLERELFEQSFKVWTPTQHVVAPPKEPAPGFMFGIWVSPDDANGNGVANKTEKKNRKVKLVLGPFSKDL
ncbi:hypothetical protein BGZ99_009297 [Dissophora globulifera]|uniref:Uncharacterized protein n=1 Tax=Dissophora globulifera TaxID=979702 RepID=A0A9P6RQS9_9FUNG|nr:hypothetical protein BGZ99_009297 [Dissophora globulifera]